MSVDNSPNYWCGVADGEADNAREADGQEPIGPIPPNPDYPQMYLKGYRSVRG